MICKIGLITIFNFFLDDWRKSVNYQELGKSKILRDRSISAAEKGEGRGTGLWHIRLVRTAWPSGILKNDVMSDHLEVGEGPLQAPNEGVCLSALAAYLLSVVRQLGSEISSPFHSLEFTYWATFSTQHLTRKLKIPFKIFFTYMPSPCNKVHKLYPQQSFSGPHSGPNHSYFRHDSNKCFLAYSKLEDGRKIDQMCPNQPTSMWARKTCLLLYYVTKL